MAKSPLSLSLSLSARAISTTRCPAMAEHNVLICTDAVKCLWITRCLKKNFTFIDTFKFVFRGHAQVRGYFQSVSQSVCLDIEYPCGACDQILLPVGMLLSEICGLVSVGRPLWREDGSAICSVITHWSESRRTRKHTLLSHLRLPQPGGPSFHIYIPQEQGGPVIPPDTGSSLTTRRATEEVF
jgi:hypothetical protein